MAPYGKIGRNDPCPCGSGKKFKKCCLEKGGGDAREQEDPRWQSIRRAIDGCTAGIFMFAAETYGEPLLEEAWRDFLGTGDTLPPEKIHLPVFGSWLAYRWMPDPFSDWEAPEELREATVAGVFLRKRGKRLDPVVVRYIRACEESVFSFHDILTVTPGTGFRLREIFIGETVDVLEKSVSETAIPGAILFGNVVRIDGIHLLDAIGAYLIPASMKPEVLELRTFIRKNVPVPTREDLEEFEPEILDLYLDLTDAVRNPKPPEMRNTDGEPIVLHEMEYGIDSADQVFRALSDLSIGDTEEELLESAVLDGNGALSEVTIRWLKPGNAIHESWDNTVLGTIRIRGKALVAETNSDNRAQVLRTILEERLGDAARFISDKVVSHDELQTRAAGWMKRGSEDGEPALRPVVSSEAMEEAAEKLLTAHYRDWARKPLPILGGKTPMEAVRTEDGRDILESLLLEMENKGLPQVPPSVREIFREIRAELGL